MFLYLPSSLTSSGNSNEMGSETTAKYNLITKKINDCK